MNAGELTELLHEEPFEPFRVRLSSGDTYEVHNPDLAVVMRSRLFLAFPGTDRQRPWKKTQALAAKCKSLTGQGAP